MKRLEERVRELGVRGRCPDCGGPMPNPIRVALTWDGGKGLEGVCATCRNPELLVVELVGGGPPTI